jgi:hypothetical protein
LNVSSEGNNRNHHYRQGPSIKNDKQYEALIKKGMSEEKPARISNGPQSGKNGGKASD